MRLALQQESHWWLQEGKRHLQPSFEMEDYSDYDQSRQYATTQISNNYKLDILLRQSHSSQQR